jgi:lysophospholipase L1-like esterase
VTALVGAYEAFIARARGEGILVYGVPLLPFAGSIYDGEPALLARQDVNRWIRESGRFDAVLDFDAVVRDPSSPERLNAAYDSGDGLHPSAAGYRAMANAIDLSLFTLGP